MTNLAHWWSQVWPNLAANTVWAAPAFTWHHWKIKATVAQHMLHITAVLNDRLEIQAGVGEHRGTETTP